MRLSRRSEYGLRALTDLVRHEGEGPIALATLASRNRLPNKFLEQIMATLKHGGIVRTTLGAHGGHTLAAHPTAVPPGRGMPPARGSDGGHAGAGDPPARWGAGAARLCLVALLRAVLVRGRGDLPAARRH